MTTKLTSNDIRLYMDSVSHDLWPGEEENGDKFDDKETEISVGQQLYNLARINKENIFDGTSKWTNHIIDIRVKLVADKLKFEDSTSGVVHEKPVGQFIDKTRTLGSIWNEFLFNVNGRKSVELYPPETLRANAITEIDNFINTNYTSDNTKILVKGFTPTNQDYHKAILRTLINIRNAINEKDNYLGSFQFTVSFGRKPGFVYYDEIFKGAMSKFRKLVNNIKSFIFFSPRGDFGKLYLKRKSTPEEKTSIYQPDIFEKALLTQDIVGGKRTNKKKARRTRKGRKHNRTRRG